MAKIITIEDFAKRLKLTKCVAKTILNNYRFIKHIKRLLPDKNAKYPKLCVVLSEEFAKDFICYVETYRAERIHIDKYKRELEELLVESI